eukprot:789268-Prymnesium_polylepis.1
MATESPHLAHELCVQLMQRENLRQLTHQARRIVRTTPIDILVPLIEQALQADKPAAAAALARGLGVLDHFDFEGELLRCYESGRLHEVTEIIGGEPAMRLRALRAMLRESRCLHFAVQHLGSLQQLQPPPAPVAQRLGAAALAA